MWTISPTRLYAAGLWAAAALAIAGPAHANLVQNGNFDAATFDPWSVSGNVILASGAAIFNAGDQPPNAILSQAISTTAGQFYALTFQYSWGSYNGSGQSITATVLDGLTVLATALDSPPYADASTSGGYQPFELGFIASSASTTIQFADYPGNNTISSDSALTGVDVEVPEPASLSLLALGAAATLLRRSRRKALRRAA